MVAHASHVTTDHDEIQRWVEARGGQPVTVRGTERSRNDAAGILRIDFPEAEADERLEPISWDDWFQKFDAENLAMILQDKKADGEISYFNKIVSRETAR